MGPEIHRNYPKDITIIKHARKSLLFHNNHTWSKRNPESTFVVSIGSYGGSEIWELVNVSLFILNSLQELFGKDVGSVAKSTRQFGHAMQI